MVETQKDKRLFVSAAILIVVHISGIIGINSSYKDLFLLCTPVNLLLSLGLLLWNHKDFNKAFLLFSLITFFTAYFIEVTGVKTRMIFGEYAYGATLGPKLMDVPLIIGINWLILIYSVGVMTSGIRTSVIVKSILGGALLAITDIFIEKVAIKYDFWHWWGANPPLQNYLAWFIVSSLLLFGFHSFAFKKENKLAKILFSVQLIFFITLSFI